MARLINTPTADLLGVRVAVLGCGALGSALAFELSVAGAVPVLWSRNGERALELLGRMQGEGEVAGSAALAVEGAELALLCVADDALAGFAEELAAVFAKEPPEQGGHAALLHTNGTFGPSVLAPLGALGFATGKAHPLFAVPPVSGQVPEGRFRETWFATAGSEAARGFASRLVGALGARELSLAGDGEEASARLHAAASLLSGGLVALFDLARETAAGTPDFEAALLALLRSTLQNLEERGAKAALTGPIARGAAGLVARQLAALDPSACAAYRVLGLRMLELARERGTVAGAEAIELARLLGG